ncbi:MAG: O-antigen ligase family protein [Anaerolineae bacterium]|nr:O-antigen ligase family protein [Anaerolineae bacterium]
MTDYYRQLAARALVLLLVTYVLVFGGTFNGMLNMPFPVVSLVLLTILAVGWLVILWIRPLQVLPGALLTPAIALWAAAFIFSTLYNSSGRTYTGLWYAGLYTAAWWVLSDCRQRGLRGQWITDGALLASVPLLIFGLAQVMSWFPVWLVLDGVEVAFIPPRPSGSLGNPNTFGAVLALLLPFGIVRARWSERSPDRVLWSLWVLAALGMLYLTYSRGAWLAAGVALVTLSGLALHRWNLVNFAAWRAWWRRLPHRIRFGIGAGGLVVLVLGVALVLAALRAFDTPRRDTGERIRFYETAVRDFRDQPLTGTGPFTFGLSLLEEFSVPPDHPHAHAHNLVLNVAAEMGLPGLIALAATVMLIARHGWRALARARDVREWAYTAACGAALVAIGAHSLIDMPLMTPAVMLLVLGILPVGAYNHTPPQNPFVSGILYRLAALALWGSVLVVGWWSVSIYADYVRGERLLVDGEYRAGADVLREVAAAQPDIALYHAQYGYACGLAVYAGDETLLQPGIAAYRRALDREAPHAVWWTNLAALYWQANEYDHAISAMLQAVDYAPDDPDLWLNLGVYYEESGQNTQAQEVYRRVLALDVRWGHASFWTLTPLRRELLATNPPLPTPSMRAERLWQAGQRDAALDILQREIDRDPTQPDPYTDIARLYLLAGELDRAGDYLEAARLLIHTDLGRAWLYAVEAELALAKGDHEMWAARRESARDLVLPDKTGRTLYYGREVAYFQFLRVRVRGSLLPQVNALGPDPILADLLFSRE